MILGEPPRTQFDVNFSLFGFPVRIAPFFWIAAVLLGYGNTQGDPPLLLAWILAVGGSILIHELGHAFAFRYFGSHCHIVLYHFGGLAVPDSHSMTARDPYRQIAISIAGPVAQLSGALLMMMSLLFLGYSIPLFGFVGNLLPIIDAPGPPLSVYWFVVYFLYISVYWSLLNLLPIYPLDGGQISRELFVIFSRTDGIKNSLLLSVFTAGAVALFALTNRDNYLMIMFGMLAYSSYQTLQAYNGRGSGYGRGW